MCRTFSRLLLAGLSTACLLTFAADGDFSNVTQSPRVDTADTALAGWTVRAGRTLLTADFNEDGLADLVVGYGADTGGLLSLQTGTLPGPRNLDRTPFAAEARLLELPVVPDFLFSGDGDGDGRRDLLLAQYEDDAYYLLAGDGRGGFAAPVRVALPGPLTALYAGDFRNRNGITDTAVVVRDAEGARLLIFEGTRDAVEPVPYALALPDADVRLSTAHLDDDGFADLLVATGTELRLYLGADPRPRDADAEVTALPAAAADLLVVRGDTVRVNALLQDGTLVSADVADLLHPASETRTKALTSARRVFADPADTARLLSSGGDRMLLFDGRNLVATAGNGPAAATALPEATHTAKSVRLGTEAGADLLLLMEDGTVAYRKAGGGTTFQVTHTDDTDDGTCDAGHCSLREAINAANANGGTDTIDFSLLTPLDHTITLTGLLPKVFDSVILDGTTHPDGFVSVITSGGTYGFECVAGGNTLTGLHLFDGGTTTTGIYLNGGGNNVVTGNIIGLDDAGNAAGFSNGIRVKNSANDLIGGTFAGAGNHIAGNTYGVLVEGGSGTDILGNTLGLSLDGTALRSNTYGIGVNSGGIDITIGGTDAGAGNVLADANGIRFFSGWGTVRNNQIGLDAAGTTVLATGTGNGIVVTDNGILGGSAANAGNSVDGYEHAVVADVADVLIQGNSLGTHGPGPGAASKNALYLVFGGGTATVGGHGMGEANQLQNHLRGIFASGSSGTLDWSGNSFVGNTGVGIDNCVGGSGPNHCMSVPDIRTYVDNSDNVSVTFSVDPTGATLPITVHFYKGDGSAVPQGAVHLGEDTDSGAEKTVDLGTLTELGLVSGDQITALAVDADGNASAFSDVSPVVGAADRTLTVNTTSDTDDGTCDGAHCSLREAINHANNDPSIEYIIAFALPGPGYDISPVANMPLVNSRLEIDGTTQPGYAGTPLVHLHGDLLTGSATGLVINHDDVIVRGLAISGYSYAGINVFNGNQAVLERNFIGTSADGNSADGNGIGILLTGSGNRVGGIGVGNLISGNTVGIQADGDDNLIYGNTVGTNLAGDGALGNSTGILLHGSGNRVGDTTPGTGNLISGNIATGINLAGPGNTVLGNHIGTNAATTSAVANLVGITLSNGDGSVIGDGTAAGANTVSGNGTGMHLTAGTGSTVLVNHIGTTPAGDAALPNVTGMMLSTTTPMTVADNLISGNTAVGVSFAGDGGQVTFTGNLIGTNAAGSGAVPNGTGLSLTDVAALTIGGAGVGNTISGNTGNGVSVSGTNGIVTLSGNHIGTDLVGTSALPNGGHGVALMTGNTAVGTAAAGNLISGNTGHGVYVAAAGNVLRNNLIGTDAGGNTALGNGGSGVQIDGAAGTTVRGNTVSANTVHGLHLLGPGTTGTAVDGNTVGTDNLLNDLGNGGHGLFIEAGADTLVGNLFTNVIAHNGGDGIRITGGTGHQLIDVTTYDNAGLGIDLGGDGVTANDAGDADSGPNNLQNFPVLTAVSSGGGNIMVEGTLNSTASSTFDVAFWISDNDPSGHGEGEIFLGRLTGVTTNGAGNATFAGSFIGDLAVTETVTAVATDAAGNASEFSQGLVETVFSDGFESGDVSAWQTEPSTLAADGSLEVLPAASGSGLYGLRLTAQAGAPWMLRDDTPAEMTGYRARFYLRADNLNLPSGETFDLFVGYDVGDQPVFRVTLLGTGSGIQVTALTREDGAVWTTPLAALLGAGYHALEVSLTAGAGTGGFALSLDDVSVGEDTGLTNTTALVDTVRLGFVDGLDAGTTGSLDVDAFASTTGGSVGPETCPVSTALFDAAPNWPSTTVRDLIGLLPTCN